MIRMSVKLTGQDKVARFLDQRSGKPLERRVDGAFTVAARPGLAETRTAELDSGITNRTRTHYRSLKSRKGRKRPGEIAVRIIGPTDRKKHLLLRGHRIVTRGGRDTGTRAPAFPYLDPIADDVERDFVERVMEALR